MICISLADISFEECLEAVRKFELAELRLDRLELTDEQTQQLFAANKNLIATCRPGTVDDDERKRRLLHGIEMGAAYLNIEMDSNDNLKAELIKAAREKNCKVIVSYIDREKTPLRGELEHILSWCEESDPDIIGIICMVNDENENARLLGLLDHPRPMIVVGMGEKGKMSRIAAPLLGAFCTFASYTSDKATGPGQLAIEDLQAIMKRIQEL